MPAGQTQAQLRLAFARWGLPLCLRVDNGIPWGSWNDLPTAFALWLVGLGLEVIWNPPRQPQDNGVVERSHQTGQCWAEPGLCRSALEVQVWLDRLDAIQREEYPAINGRGRLAAYPGLAHSGRRYDPPWEQANWSLERAKAHLAAYQALRLVDSQGRVSIYDRPRYVGVKYKKQQVHVHYDPDSTEWVIADDESRYLCRVPAPEICRERVMGLALSTA